MVRNIILLFCVVALNLFTTTIVKTQDVSWLDGSGDSLAEIGGLAVKQFKNAGTGGVDWTVIGRGGDGGNGRSQLWLLNAPNTAKLTFMVKSSAVGFMMSGDDNDGYARFVVDGRTVGTFDLYNLGEKTLVVSHLPYSYHTIEVVQLTG